jgi:hypothetical protein
LNASTTKLHAGRLQPLRQITAGQLLDINFPPREFAIEPWLKTGESALLWAATGVGKTWLALSLALAMAGGGKVWKWSAPKARKVLYIDGEMNVQDLQERTRMLLDRGGVEADREALRSNLLFLPRQYQDPRATFYDITNGDHQRRVLARLEETGAEVIIIDNLTTCADGLDDENSATAFRSVMAFLLMMKQAGKTAILVHHANKAGADARGSTALEATFEVKLGLHKPQVTRPGSAHFEARFGKFRGLGSDAIAPHVWLLDGDTGRWIVEEDGGGTEDRVLAALRTLNYVNQEEIGRALGMTQSAVSKALAKLAARGDLKKGDIERMLIEARAIRRGEQDPFGNGPGLAEGEPEAAF